MLWSWLCEKELMSDHTIQLSQIDGQYYMLCDGFLVKSEEPVTKDELECPRCGRTFCMTLTLEETRAEAPS